MIRHNLYSKKSINIIIIISFFMSILLSFHYLSKYDKLVKIEYAQKLGHPMIKSAVQLHWFEADQIITDIKDKKKFLEYGKDYDEFLPQRILALYYYITGDTILDKNGNHETNNGKFLYLVLKTLLFYLSIIYLKSKITKILPIKNCFFIISFLVLEPTIFQFHSSFWNESLFFPLQILLLSYLVSSPVNLFVNFSIGILLGVMFGVSVESFYLILPIIIFQILKFKKKSLKIVASSIFGFIIVLSIISLHNFKRTNTFFFMNDGAKSALYFYIAPSVLSISESIPIESAQSKMNIEKLEWINENKIKVSFNNKKFRDLGNIDNKIDRLKYYNYLQYTSLKIIIKNPLSTVKFMFKKNLHTIVLDPFFIKNFYKFEMRGKLRHYKSETHANEIPYRIIYSGILYMIILSGFFYSLKNVNKIFMFSIVILTLYPIFILGWMGVSRYFVPSLIYLSIFFGNGITNILDIMNNKNKI